MTTCKYGHTSGRYSNGECIYCRKAASAVTQLKPISQLIAEGAEIQCGGYTLQRWSNGIYFVEQPSGEGTEIDQDALAAKLRELFEEHF